MTFSDAKRPTSKCVIVLSLATSLAAKTSSFQSYMESVPRDPAFPFTSTQKETNILIPPSITRDATFVTDVAPADRWNYELLEKNGELKIKKR